MKLTVDQRWKDNIRKREWIVVTEGGGQVGPAFHSPISAHNYKNQLVRGARAREAQAEGGPAK